MRRHIFLAVVSIIICSNCWARLGENKEEILARYGKPKLIEDVQPYDRELLGMKTVVKFGPENPHAPGPPISVNAYLDKNDICQRIDFQFDFYKFKFADDKNIDAAKKAVLDILEKNAQGNKWTAAERPKDPYTLGDDYKTFQVYHWARSDGGEASWARIGGGTLILYSGEFTKLNKKMLQDGKTKEGQDNKKALDNL